eukprot:scaffold283476_cov19-Tisochrysis_lutea.AAC.2
MRAQGEDGGEAAVAPAHAAVGRLPPAKVQMLSGMLMSARSQGYLSKVGRSAWLHHGPHFMAGSLALLCLFACLSAARATLPKCTLVHMAATKLHCGPRYGDGVPCILVHAHVCL